jgi:fluoroquinolone transport system permease protein
MAEVKAAAPRSLIVALIAADMRSVARNRLLALLAFMPLLVVIVYRFVIPDEAALAELARERFSVELEGIRPLIVNALMNLHALLMAIFVGLSASMIGAVYGLLLVEEREDRLMPSLRVMPVSFATYMIARMALPTLGAMIVTTLAYPIAGMAPLSLPKVLAIAAAGATLVPVITMGVVAFAPGRVAAFALVRLLSLLAVLPVIAWFIDPPAEWVFAPIVAYWQMRALWSAVEGGSVWPDLAIAAVVNLVSTAALYWRFVQRRE